VYRGSEVYRCTMKAGSLIWCS